MNEFTFKGFLEGKPELKTSKNNLAILNFVVSRTDCFKGKETVQYGKFTMFGQKAMEQNDTLRSADEVLVKGRLSARKWEGRWFGDAIADSVEVILSTEVSSPEADVDLPF